MNIAANEDPEGYSRYDCQWLKVKSQHEDDTFATRILHITEAKTTTPGNHSTSPAEWRDIYISARPRHRAHLKSDISELVARLAINAPNFPSLRIQPSMISNGSYYCCAATQLPPESHPWMGHPPFNLVFKIVEESDRQLQYACVLTLGVCRGINKGIAVVASNNPSNTLHYYAVLRNIWRSRAEDEISSGTYEATAHDCGKDHVSDGSIVRGWGEYFDSLQISFRRSLVDTRGDTLEVYSLSRQYYVSQSAYDRGLIL